MRTSKLLASLILCLAPVTFAEDAAPTTKPATTKPADAKAADEKPADSKPAASPQVQAILDEVGKAYGDAQALTLSGKLSLDFDAGDDKPTHQSADFTASFVAPNKFRHEVKDDVLVVSTGEKVYGYLPGKNEYVSVEAPKARIESKDLSAPITDLLGAQDPVLLMTISKDPLTLLTGGATNLAKADDVRLGDISFSAITFDKSDRAYRVLVDPTSHFIRQIRIDRKAEVKKRGVADVKTADVTFDYVTTKAGDAPAEDLYAWAPPRDATVAKEDVPEAASAGAATALKGKAAPDFTLTAIDGAKVTLADLKGSVVVLDFWATWCGPCVASLPHIDQINTDFSEKGLKVFAVNLQEPKAAVQKFVVTKKLTLPVLLDTDGATGKKYMANAIPETVIIGKDGNVAEVFVGFGGDEPLRKAIEAEMAK